MGGTTSEFRAPRKPLGRWWPVFGLLLVVGLFWWSESVEVETAEDPAAEPDEPRSPGDGGRLKITAVKPVEVTPGGAIVVQYGGGVLDESVRVTVDKADAEVVDAATGRLVVRVPTDVKTGRAKVRLHQEGVQRSKSRDLQIKSLKLRKVIRNVLGGLALFLFGLRTLARGLRGWAGQPTRRVLATWTRRTTLGLLAGAFLGALTQAVTSAAGLVAGLVESRLLRMRAALLALLGAHFGAGVAVLILPLGLTREALWVVAAGVVWISLARTRRQTSLGKILLGLGLLFYGLSLLRAGFGPLVADPTVLDRLHALRDAGASGLAARVGLGATLGAVLQGPGAAFGLVLGITESTGLLDLRQALQILAGTNFGAGVATLAVAAPFGPRVRRLALVHLGLTALVTLAFLVAAPAAEFAVDALLRADVFEPAYGKKVLFPNVAPHLTLAFVASQALCIVGAAALVGPATRLVGTPAKSPSNEESEQPLVDEALFGRNARSASRVLGAARELVSTGEREPAARAEAELARARGSIVELVDRVGGEGSARAKRLRATAGCMLNVFAALERLVLTSERGLEKGYEIEDAMLERFDGMAALVRAGLDHVGEHLEHARPLDLDVAQDVELQLNAAEAEARGAWLAQLEDASGRTKARLWAVELAAAYESVGNQIYRLVATLEDDELL